MTSTTVNHNQLAAQRRGSHLRLAQPSRAASDTHNAVRLVPAGTPEPDGWRTVTVAAAADANGVHQPTWELQFDTSIIASVIRGDSMHRNLHRQLFNDDWEEVLCDRPDGAPLHGSFLVQRHDAPSLVEKRERSRLVHPSNTAGVELGF